MNSKLTICLYLKIETNHIRGESRFSYAMSHNDANKMNLHPAPTTCHMHHSSKFNKIDSFVKPVSDNFNLCNLIVGWGKEVIKERVFCIKSISLGEVLIAGEVGFIKLRVGII